MIQVMMKEKRRVRQFYPTLFNTYVKKLTEEVLENGSVKMGDKIKIIKYADDEAVLVESEEELQWMMRSTVGVGKELGMNINVETTEIMRFRSNGGYINLILERQTSSVVT